MNKLLVIGYYSRGNLGDESYMSLMPNFFPNYSLDFVSSDDLEGVDSSNYFGIVVGGGDIINDYFNTKIKSYLQQFKGPKLAFSIGIPFQSLITNEYFDHFDKVLIRNHEDLIPLQQLLGSERIGFTPDIGFSLTKTIESERDNIIGVFLVGNIIRFPNIVNNLAKLVAEMSLDSKVVLYCFNPEEDSQISLEVLVKAHMLQHGEISIDTESYTEVEMINIISRLKLAVCMRYHAHVFAVASDTPILSISPTRKTRSLMEYGNLKQFQYEIPLDDYCTPTDEFNYDELINIYYSIDSSDLIHEYNVKNRFLLKSMKQQYFFDSYKPLPDRVIDLLKVNDYSNAARLISYEVTQEPDTKFNYGLIEKLESVKLTYDDVLKLVEEFTNYYLGLPPDPIPQPPDITGLLPSNLYIDLAEYSSYNGVHRGGWYLAAEKLAALNEYNELGRPKGILCDMYVDRTFHWANNYMKITNKIPYTAPWCGFIHHTDNDSYANTYNLNKLFENEEFLISLNTCIALFTLNNNLKLTIENKLRDININVNVINFTHPVVEPTILFSTRRFQESIPKIVNIGAWMRNPFTIYTIDLHPSFYHLKYALKGKDMHQYFPPENMNIVHGVAPKSEQSYNRQIVLAPCRPCRPCRPDPTITIWVDSMLNWLKERDVDASFADNTLYIKDIEDYEYYKVKIPEMINKVNTIEHLDNELYDQMLADFVVFLDLVDAAAVNTVLECIVRNTPLIINKIPGTVNLLGNDYPLYYESEEDLKKINFTKIIQTNTYLKKINKDKYKINYFVNDLLSKISI